MAQSSLKEVKLGRYIQCGGLGAGGNVEEQDLGALCSIPCRDCDTADLGSGTQDVNL